MSKNPVETIMGAVVLLVASFFVVFAFNTASVRAIQGYEIRAPFNKVGGLDNGSDVRISGIKVGTVSYQSLDPDTYQAVVYMSIKPDVQLPVDTVASIASEGLLGGKYVKLSPGGAAEKIQPGDLLEKTDDYRSLEDLVGDIIFLATQDAGGN